MLRVKLTKDFFGTGKLRKNNELMHNKLRRIRNEPFTPDNHPGLL